MGGKQIILTSFWRSSCSWRVRIALAYKGLAHKISTIHLQRDGGEQFTAAYREKNPMSQVPLLEIKGNGSEKPYLLSQSMAVMEYLEEVYPDPPILPSSPIDRARVRQIAEIINSGIQPLQNSATMKKVEAAGGDKASWAKYWIEDGLGKLERQTAEFGNTRFLVSDSPTIAEFCLVPQLYGARRFGCEVNGWPRLLEVEARCLTLPAFESTCPENQLDAEN